jgi:hypothetical protein
LKNPEHRDQQREADCAKGIARENDEDLASLDERKFFLFRVPALKVPKSAEETKLL